MRPSRQSVYAVALAAILLSQQIVSQTPSSSHPSTNPTTASNGTASGQGELHSQRYVREQQRANCSAAGELFRATPGRDRTVSGRKL